MPDLNPVDEMLARVTDFRRDLGDQGIHVGVSIGDSPATCVVDGEPWPCTHQQTT